MTAVIAISLLIGGAVGLIAGIVFYVLFDKPAECDDALDVAEAAGVAVSDVDGSHDDLDVDAKQWAAEMALLERAWSPEVPIIPGRLPGEGR